MESLYWILSTLPQVSAALVAFVGFLVLQRLDQLARRKTYFESQAKEMVLNRHPRKPPFDKLGTPRISGMASSTFMATLRQATQTTPEYASFSLYCDEWEPLNNISNRVRRTLLSFALKNLIIIGVSLAALPLVPGIKCAGDLAIFVAAILTVVLALYVGWEAYKMIRESVTESTD